MISSRILLAVALGLGLVKAEQASSFDVSPEVAEQYGCGPDCLAAIAQGNAMDLKNFGTDFDFDFYATAANFSCSKPGDVLKLHPVNSSLTTVNAGTTVYKMQYTSEDLDGSPVPATAFIAFPFAETAKPFNLVAYAHGTSGFFRGCAPSASSTLYGFATWSPLVIAGYAVVGTDYAGIGNNYTAHKYASNTAHANDVVYSAMAAKKAFPQQISSEWVSLGHSQGGGAVWKLSEHEIVQDPKSGYLGGVAMAPAAAKMHEQVQIGLAKLLNATEPRDFKILTSVMAPAGAIQRVFPDYNPTWLSDAMKMRMGLAEVAQLCVAASAGLIIGLTPEQILNELDVSGDTIMAEFQKLNAPGQGDPASKPLLITQGKEDAIIPWESTKAAFDDSCKQGNPVHLSLYPGLDHSALVEGGSPEWLRFIADRFASVPFNYGCTETVAKPFNVEYAESPLDL